MNFQLQGFFSILSHDFSHSTLFVNFVIAAESIRRYFIE